MAQKTNERLVSVSFDKEDLAALKVIADLHDTSVADEIRKAVDKHIASQPK
jgi:hypothetical protein